MAEKRWTKAQQAAIEDEGGSLLIDAAAGSGKTAVLVERALTRLVREDAPLRADRLLILTFTNAAAEELRARLGARLEEALLQNPASIFLRRQKMLLHRAYIGTIDAFCQQLVREHFSQLGLPPDITVGQEAELDALAQSALQTTLEEMYEDDAFVQLTGLYGRSRSDAEAAEAILRLHGYVNSLPWPNRQLKRFAAMYQNSPPLPQTEWGAVLLQHGREALESCVKLAQTAFQLAEADGELDAWLPALSADTEALEALRQTAQTQSWNDIERLLRGFAPARLGSVRGYEGRGKETIKTLRERIKKSVEDLRKNCFACTEEEYLQDIANAAPLVQALCRAAERYTQNYLGEKLEAKVLDFADFEHYTLALLSSEEGDRSPEADAVSARYDMVMVDEYQDTNELQSALYACLGNAEGSNLFYVGDVKQSIYRFRRANPGLFLAKKAAWAPYESGKHPAVLRLGHNFRSSPSVIHGVNFLFGQLMSEALGEVRYGEEEQLIQGGEGGGEDGFGLTLLEDPEGLGDAAFVAGEIKRMVLSGLPVRQGDTQRPCAYGDFCILLRTRTAMAAYLAALEAAGIPAACDLDDEVMNSPEVLPLRAMLAAISNPGDDISLAAAMLGPLYRFSPDEITALRAESPKGSLYGALLQREDIDEKVNDFLTKLRHYRGLAAEMSTGRLCEEIVLRTGYLSAVAAMEGGYARRECLNRFLAWAGEVGGSLSGGLTAFVRLCEGGKGPRGAGYQGLAGHVSLLTAHKSKGLEFPIVFFADTARGFNKRDRGERIQFHARLGIGLWLRSGQTLFPTLPLLAIRQMGESEALSEEMRILYVALTRAKERLYLTYTCQDPAKKLAALAGPLAAGAQSPYLLSRYRSFGEWLLSALLKHPDAAPLWRLAGLTPCTPTSTQSRLQCQLLPAVQVGEEASGYELDAKPDEAAAERLAEGFSLLLPRQALGATPRKLSVSALAKSGPPSVRRRPALLYKSGLTAAERGTAMHSFLQLAAHAAAAKDLPAEIARLEALGILGKEEAAALDRAGLRAFFSSRLAQRMAGADTLLREYDFITALPAGRLDKTLPPPLSEEPLYLQGIADAVLIQNGSAEIADYKTDRGKTAEELRESYAGQLRLYAEAIQKRLGLPVVKLTLWSFALAAEVDVPL